MTTTPRHAVGAPAPTTGDAVRFGVRGLGELCITAGAFLLLFLTWQLWWTDVEANQRQARIVDDLETQWVAAPPPAPDPEPVEAAVETPVRDVPETPGEAFAILRVPTFSDDYAEPIVTGTGLPELQLGIGHYDGAASPGEVGNFAIAGHRTTYGAPLWQIDELAEGDPLVVQTADGYYTYRVTSADIVLPSEISVVAPVPGDPTATPTEAMITLTSCHPRYSARERYIVHGQFESFQPVDDGPPPVLAAG